MYSIGAATESADATRELLPCLSRPSLERVSDAATAFGNSGEVQNSCHNYYIQITSQKTLTLRSKTEEINYYIEATMLIGCVCAWFCCAQAR